jgi:hypothetical protein
MPNDLVDDVRNQVIADLRAADFHNGGAKQSHSDYYNQAEAKINAMSNMELLEVISKVSA